MLNYSRALRNDGGVWSKSFLYALLTAPLCEATMGIFSHCANTNFATFLLQTGGSPPSLNTQHTFSFLITLLLLPIFCAFPHGLLYIPSAENRASNIKLEVPTSWHKQTQKSRQNKLSHFWIICALIAESKTLLLRNEKWCGFLHNKLSPNKTYPCDTKLALPGTVLHMEKNSMRLIFTCLLGYWKWKIFHSMNDLLSLQHPSLLGQNFYTPPNSQTTCTAINPLAHTFHIFQTDGSLGMNYTWFHS